jgi:hypothetical protein
LPLSSPRCTRRDNLSSDAHPNVCNLNHCQPQDTVQVPRLVPVYSVYWNNERTGRDAIGRQTSFWAGPSDLYLQGGCHSHTFHRSDTAPLSFCRDLDRAIYHNLTSLIPYITRVRETFPYGSPTRTRYILSLLVLKPALSHAHRTPACAIRTSCIHQATE